MSPWGCLDLENELREAPVMMEKISAENDDFRPENIFAQDVPYAFRITQGAFWKPGEVFWMTFRHLKVDTFLARNVRNLVVVMFMVGAVCLLVELGELAELEELEGLEGVGELEEFGELEKLEEVQCGRPPFVVELMSSEL